MDELISLWLPIIVSAVVVHVASAIAWMFLPHHKPDWKRLPNEEQTLDKLRSENIPAGQYIFPYIEPSEMKKPESQARYEAGPHGTLNLWPGKPSMGRNMLLTFLFFVVTSIFVAYLASRALDPGAPYLDVFQIVGTAAILAYCFASIPNDIWFGKTCRAVCMNILDGIVYGLLTAGVFGWLWPGA